MFWPMKRLAEWMTLVGSVSRYFFASEPMTTPPLPGNATTDGWTRSPRAPRMNSTPVGVEMAAHEFVVPRSIPRAIGIPATASVTQCEAEGKCLQSPTAEQPRILVRCGHWMRPTPLWLFAHRALAPQFHRDPYKLIARLASG